MSRHVWSIALLLLPSRQTRRSKDQHRRYESRLTTVFWVPLIVSPDVVASINGGWQSSKMEDGGDRFRRMLQRLADDIRARPGGEDDDGAATSAKAVGVTCPRIPKIAPLREGEDLLLRRVPVGAARRISASATARGTGHAIIPA